MSTFLYLSFRPSRFDCILIKLFIESSDSSIREKWFKWCQNLLYLMQIILIHFICHPLEGNCYHISSLKSQRHEPRHRPWNIVRVYLTFCGRLVWPLISRISWTSLFYIQTNKPYNLLLLSASPWILILRKKKLFKTYLTCVSCYAINRKVIAGFELSFDKNGG